MAELFTIKQGDTRPKLQYAMTYTATAGGIATTLVLASTAERGTASQVKLKARLTGTITTPKINATAAIASPLGGVVEYTWQTADTDVAATYSGEWEVLWSDGGISTIPNDSEFTIVVRDDLDLP